MLLSIVEEVLGKPRKKIQPSRKRGSGFGWLKMTIEITGDGTVV